MPGRRAAGVAVAATLTAAALALAGCGGSSSGSSSVSNGSGGSGHTFKVGMAVGGQGLDWQDAQGQVAKALAKQRGWDYMQLSNDNNAATASKNADLFIRAKADAVIEFNAQPSVNAVMAEKFKAAHIPVITYDIPQPGWYFVGIDNKAAGEKGGEALGNMIKEKWGCEPDLVLAGEAKAAGPINAWRTGGMRDGIKKVCPAIQAGAFASYETSGQTSIAVPAARDVLAAHPAAKKIAFVGINDSSVVGGLQAAAQLHRAGEAIGWGQDGSLITGSDVDTHLAGSVFYFLEAYPVQTYTEILDKVAAGTAPAVKDTPDGPAISIPPCPVTAEQARQVPDMQQRITKLLAAPKGTTAMALFCPKG